MLSSRLTYLLLILAPTFAATPIHSTAVDEVLPEYAGTVDQAIVLWEYDTEA